MSLFKKATTFISIFNEVRAKNEAQRSALKRAEEMRLEREYGYIPSIWSDIRDFFSDSQTRELRNIRRELQKMNNNK